ncbi:MAG: MMPL family transporter, partial [Planctomycetales bacterium]|nr:MMPL family transporter [Planctomycetales bacterium]
VIASPWIVAGTMTALESNANSPLDWVDDGFAPRQKYDRFSDQFGSADVVVISWPGCRIDDPRLDTFVRSLRKASGFQGPDGWLFHHVTCGRQTHAALTGAPLSLSTDEATRRLCGTLIGPDGQTTCVVIGFTKSGLEQRGRLVPLIRTAARHHCGAAMENQHLAGPIMDGYCVDQASQSTMHRFAPLASIVAFCLCVFCLESLIAGCLVFGISLACQAIALSVLHYSGGSMTALLIVLPPLIQLLAIAGGIHFVNYYFEFAPRTSPATAVRRALRIAWVPCLLSAATTAIGLGSLAVSGLVAVREFGIYAAIGVIATVAILLSFLPGAVLWLGPNHAPITGPVDSTSHGSSVWHKLTAWVERHGGFVSVSACLLMIGLGLGVSRLEASVRIETLFGQGSRLLSDYAWIEQNVGSMVPIEVIASFPAHSNQSALDKMETLRQIETVLRELPTVDAVTSPLDFMPELSDPDVQSASQAMGFSRPIVANFNFVNTSDGGIESWRTTAYTSALGKDDYVRLVSDLDDLLARTLANRIGDDGLRIETSGLMPLVHEIQRQLLADLFASFVTAFILIAGVMTIVHAGFVTGLLSMIPNVFPAMTLFGLLGWCGHRIDIGSIMTASVAMGIAVDDTLHFLNYFERELAAGKPRRDAVLGAYTHCGRAMIQTTLICGGGFAMFAFSDFVPTARFAWMMILLLVAALVGDLIILPAILLGRAGKRFDCVSPKVADDMKETAVTIEHYAPVDTSISDDAGGPGTRIRQAPAGSLTPVRAPRRRV